MAWAVPTILVIALLCLDRTNIESGDKTNPSFQYGNAQAAISVFLLVMCFISKFTFLLSEQQFDNIQIQFTVTVGCLVLHQRYKKRIEKYRSLAKDLSSDTSSPITESTTNLIGSAQQIDERDPRRASSSADINFHINNRVRRRLSSSSDEQEDTDDRSTKVAHPNAAEAATAGCTVNSDDCCTRKSTATTVVDIEDLMSSSKYDSDAPRSNGLCSSNFNCAGPSRQSCKTLVQQYQEQNRHGLEPIEFSDSDEDELQSMRHTVLLILLLCSMFVSLALSIWTLVMEGMSGVYVELSFLDGFLNFGQSLIVLACFITDTGNLLPQVAKYFRKIWYGANILQLPDWNRLNVETRHICDQFVTHHLENCRKAIADDKRWRIKVYKKVFYGTTFVDWLMEVGLAKDRREAIVYGQHLVDGRVLRHINNVYNFKDKNLLYTFCVRF